MLRPAAAWAAIGLVVWRFQTVLAGRSLQEAGQVLVPTAATGGSGRIDAGRVAWDSGFYLTIAEHGYRLGRGNEATFPGYPMAIRAVVGATSWDWASAAVVVSAACGLLTSVLCWRWLTLVGVDGRTRWVSLLLVLLFPPAFLLYGVAYNEPMVMAAVLGALVCARRGRWVLAGCLGAVATYTRLNVVVLPALLVAVVLARSEALTVVRPGATCSDRSSPDSRRLRLAWQPRRLRPGHAGVLLSVAGIGAYVVWLWGHAGNPLYFAWLQTHEYGHSPLWHPYSWLKFPVWRGNLIGSPPDAVHELLSLVLLVAAMASVPAVARRLDAAHAGFVAALVVISWSGTYNFAPAGRYLLPAIPILAVTWAPWLAARLGATIAVLSLAAAGSAYMASSFAGGGGLNW